MKTKQIAISTLERAFIARNVSLMIKAGNTLSESVQFVAGQARRRSTEQIIKTVAQDISSGVTFADALEQFENAFGRLFVQFVRVGEKSGTLEETLDYLAKQFEKDHDTSQKVLSATIYPLIIIGILITYATVFSFWIFPKIKNVFASFSQNLPLLTRIMIGISDWVKSWGWSIIALLIVGCILLWLKRTSKTVDAMSDWIGMHTPRVATILKNQRMSRFFAIMSFFMKSGVPITESLDYTAHAFSSRVTKAMLEKSRQRIESGENFAKSLEGTFVSPLALKLLSVAEKSGSLQETLSYCADYYQRDVDYATKNLSSVVEPLLLIVVGILVALLAIAIILPVYQFTGSVKLF